jgi:hypothetical protein
MRTNDEGKRAHPARRAPRAVDPGSRRASPRGQSTAHTSTRLSGPLLSTSAGDRLQRPSEGLSDGASERRTLEGEEREDLTSSTEARPRALASDGTDTHPSAAGLEVPAGLALLDGAASGLTGAAPTALAVEAAAPLLRRLAAIGRQIDTRLAEERSAEKTRGAEIPGYVRSTADATGETVTSEESL